MTKAYLRATGFGFGNSAQGKASEDFEFARVTVIPALFPESDFDVGGSSMQQGAGGTDHDGQRRAAFRAQEGWLLALQPAGSVHVRRTVALPDAAPRPAQGSTRLRFGVGVRQSAPAPPTIAAGNTHQELGAVHAQGLHCVQKCCPLVSDTQTVIFVMHALPSWRPPFLGSQIASEKNKAVAWQPDTF